MENSNITKEQYDAIKRYGPDAELTFHCNRCGRCCRDLSEGFPITPHDLMRIAQYLNRTPEEVYQRYCFQDTGACSLLLMVCIRTNFGDCTFLRGKKCILGDAMPGSCHFNPLGRIINLDGRIDYIDLGKSCGSKNRYMKIRDWVGEFCTEEYEKIIRFWNEFSLCTSMLLTSEQDPAIQENPAVFQDTILQECYLDMRIDEPFLPQLEAAVEQIEEWLFTVHSLTLPGLEKVRKMAAAVGEYPPPARILE